MPLISGDPFTVIAAGVQNLHVIGTRERLGPPSGQEVELHEQIDGITWSLRFFDPVVLPPLGLIDETAGAAGEQVRRALGVTTHLYHLIVQPGSQLTPHHAGHAGSGLANSHADRARDFDEIRAHVGNKDAWVDEMMGASLAGLIRAQILLAQQIAPWDEAVRSLASNSETSDSDVRKVLLAAVRGEQNAG